MLLANSRGMLAAGRRAAVAANAMQLRSLTTGVSGAADKLTYEFTDKLDLIKPESYESRKAYQVIGEDGKLRQSKEPSLSAELCQKMYENMVRLQVMDHVLYEAQRQGRISFYMQTNGEEGINIGSAAALKHEDVVFAQYREAGVLMWRGFSLQNFADQCFSNADDPGKGRQMPIHYGSVEHNFHTISSPLTTQVPQAAGAAYAFRDAGKDGPVVATYFGEGAASEGDFHAGMNFAATLECPILFLCRNNQYAISTPVQDQFRGDGIVSRAQGYGMASIRVDGNDTIAVYEAVSEARAYARENNRPVLVEMMSYRIGHHSTSDDSTAYRPIEEIESWKETAHPIPRFRKYMEAHNLWDEDKETALRTDVRKAVLQAMTHAEDKPKPDALDNLFADVYTEMPQNLVEQQRELSEQLKKYPAHYAVHH
ncbi:Pyruvate dehydrogenase E1 component subunit alpha, mitochondrial [Hondaea fermentalgiana]|uniref:2-oxoisovalerate dehydrogenase subunit alpha n=1 Tax=Hondaea fermentalgiana TaxID=2315210 RepID=A0A2R5G589_9STRA|nr:Pyruvate dehydrogenase E1 component subunit alpha, mitochondrial [Hondaea fermentalgiana]|eukprot:GBG26140.1 Pyruvate dehydrogenase E1 component subunit alpha, mitochondrial [Hondaea fermentalgiana]